MKKLKFKTNINCGGCIARVAPYLNKNAGIIKWEVDVTDPLKILIIETSSLTADVIIRLVNLSGYKADMMIE